MAAVAALTVTTTMASGSPSTLDDQPSATAHTIDAFTGATPTNPSDTIKAKKKSANGKKKQKKDKKSRKKQRASALL